MALNLTNIQNLSDGVDGLQIEGAEQMTKAVVGDTTYLYMASRTSDTLSSFRVEPDGTLTLVETIGDDATLFLDTAKTVASAEVDGSTYVIASGADIASGAVGGVSVFEVNADGTLTNTSNFADTGTTFLTNIYGQMEVLDTGSAVYVYFGDGTDNGLTVMELQSGGFLVENQNLDDDVTLNLKKARSPHVVSVAGEKFLIVGGASDNGLSVFSIDEINGTLINTQNINYDGSNFLDGVTEVTSASVGGSTFVYVASFFGSTGIGGIGIFEMDSLGQLTFRESVADNAILELFGPAVLRTVSFGGQDYIVALGLFDDGFSVFQVEEDGGLTNVLNVTDDPTLELDGTIGFEIVATETATYLYVSGRDDNGLSVFRLDAPYAVDYNGQVHDVAETLEGAVSVAQAGGTITLVNDPLLSAFSERFGVEQDNLTIDTTALSSDTVSSAIDLDRFAFNFTVEGKLNARVYGSAANSETITTDKGNDRVFGYGGDDTISTGGGSDLIKGGLGSDSINGGGGGDSIYGGAGADVIASGSGGDSVEGGASNDVIKLGGGADFAAGDNGTDSLFGGGGDDTIFGGNGKDALYGGANADELYGGEGADSLFGGSAADFLDGDAGGDVLTGGSGGDYMNGGTGKDSLIGGTGSDQIYGSSGADTIDAGDGDDTIFGGTENDRMTGGAGADDFVFKIGGGTDRIFDFEDNVDELDLDLVGLGFASVAALVSTVGTQDGADAVLDFGGDGKIIVENFTLNNLINDIF